MNELEQHLGAVGTLLDIEREAERERLAQASAQLSWSEREARGFALVDVQAVEEGGWGSRALVTFARPGPAPRELGSSMLGAGATVRVGLRREHRDDAPSGVVSRRSRGRISIVFDDPPPDWALEGRVVLELLASSATHDRLAGGVRRLRDTAAGKRWHAVVGGAAPRFDPPRAASREAGSAVDSGLGLNPEQQAAVELAGRALDVALVHGPPGTGKTSVLVAIIAGAAARGESVLACAPSNLAVDNLVERLAAAGLDPVRVGHPARVLPSVLEHTLDARVAAHESAQVAATLVRDALRLRHEARKARGRRGPGRFSEARAGEREARALLAEARALEARAEVAVLDRAPVVLATLTGLETPALAARRFQLAVIDEATQALEPAAYLALLRADRAVLAGDPLQLPPTVLSPRALDGGLGTSLFERIWKAHPAAVTTLAEQYRMHEHIMRYPSAALYAGRLRAHPSVASRALDEAPFEVIDTAGRGFEEETAPGEASRRNPGEVALAAGEVQRLLRGGLAPERIAVISPYEAQVQLLRQALDPLPEAGLEVDTVDGFQGREKVAVIVSLVRSNDAGELGFVADLRRINVALTRAQQKLIVIGDGATLRRHSFYEGLFAQAEAMGTWRSAWEREPPEGSVHMFPP